MGEAAIGVISASHYSAAADRPANRTFVSEWKKAYGAGQPSRTISPSAAGTAWRRSST